MMQTKRPHRSARCMPLLLAMSIAALTTYADAGEIRDPANVFQPGVVREVVQELTTAEKSSGIPVTILTTETLGNETASEFAKRYGKENKLEGLLVVIAKSEKKIDVVVSPKYTRAVSRDQITAIRNAFSAGVKSGGLDEGLRTCGRKIAEVLSVAKTAALAGGKKNASTATSPRIRENAVGAAQTPGQANAPGGSSLMGPLVMIVVLVVGGIILFNVMRARQAPRASEPGMGPAGYPQQDGYPPQGGYPQQGGYPPQGGYGGPGGMPYGQPQPQPRAGGGILPGLMAGIGGAMIGNWAYNRFSGSSAHGAEPGAGAEDPTRSLGASDPSPADEWGSVGDDGGNWGDGGGDGGGWSGGDDGGGGDF